MSLTSPPLGSPIPARPHAISVQLDTWQDVVDAVAGAPRIKEIQQNGYPRSFLHKDIRRLQELCVRQFATAEQTCFLFPGAEYGKACQAYLCRPPQGDGGLDAGDVGVQAIEFPLRAGFAADARSMTLHTVFLPQKAQKLGMAFWRLTGCGISSRLAEDVLAAVDAGEVPKPAAQSRTVWPRSEASATAARAVRQRIAAVLERAPVGGPRSPAVAADDVFLYPTGMAAIYNLTLALRDWSGAKTVVFGFPYELTLKTQQDFGRACAFYGTGDTAEMELLEDYLHMLAQQGRTVQAVWCECASNPLLQTADLARLRRLADRYGFLVLVDDTIGNAANVDVLGVADAVITSLTKSFSGGADVMGGSVALNPRAPFYEKLRAALAARHGVLALDADGDTTTTTTTTATTTLYGGDALVLERNSRDLLARAARMNANAAALVGRLGAAAAASAATGPLRRVYYPTTCERTVAHFRARMRAPTAEFAPGYGGLFSLEFGTVAAAARFFDALAVCKGPTIGADFTLALPYVEVVFPHDKAWARQYGLSDAIVRVSVGVEDTQSLVDRFLDALEAAKEDGDAQV